ncbi:hypothetical protein OCU04_000220 [Sclerotinia nivalis]|uniref:Uncharacterized protein n=1 Tax=Sclerotinia nivalis TaxID=352851 RepID=A0A9X0AWA0_9HELO|nr:hypothetical protein OCU04_000220 [Sclerotinia nivalis]
MQDTIIQDTVMDSNFLEEIVFGDIMMEDIELDAITEDTIMENVFMEDIEIEDGFMEDRFMEDIDLEVRFMEDIDIEDSIMADLEMEDTIMEDVSTPNATTQKGAPLSYTRWKTSEKAYLLYLYSAHGMIIDATSGRPHASRTTHTNVVKGMIREALKHRPTGELHQTDPWPSRRYSIKLTRQVVEEWVREERVIADE